MSGGFPFSSRAEKLLSTPVVTPVPTPETKAPCLASVYALSKFDQEV